MRKVFVNRKPSVGQFSIERVFETLFRAFPFDSLVQSPFTSKVFSGGLLIPYT